MYSCPKCNGTGSIECYKYVSGGICFACNGTGKTDRKPIERKPRAAQTPARKAELAAKKTQSIIASEIAYAVKRLNDADVLYPATVAILRASMDTQTINTIAIARTVAENISQTLYRLDKPIAFRTDSIEVDCPNWLEN